MSSLQAVPVAGAAKGARNRLVLVVGALAALAFVLLGLPRLTGDDATAAPEVTQLDFGVTTTTAPSAEEVDIAPAGGPNPFVPKIARPVTAAAPTAVVVSSATTTTTAPAPAAPVEPAAG